MKLYDLLNGNGITIQGDVRLSVWENDAETMVKELRSVDDLQGIELDEYEDMEINYMFAAPDGFLHIELINDSKERRTIPAFGIFSGLNENKITHTKARGEQPRAFAFERRTHDISFGTNKRFARLA